MIEEIKRNALKEYEAIKLAKLFHDVYEKLAPSYGYETREDTKEFNESSKNGQLMIATCREILQKYNLEKGK